MYKRIIVFLLLTFLGILVWNSSSDPQILIRKEQIEDAYMRAGRTETVSAAHTFQVAQIHSWATRNSIPFFNSSGILSATANPTNGQIMIGSTGAAPVLATITQGTGITVTNAAGSITLTASGAVSLACSNDTEGTTTSVTITNVVTVSSCSIGVNNGILIVASLRKTAGAADAAYVALKLNSTQVTASAINWSGTTNEVETGVFVAHVGPHDGTYVDTCFFQVNHGNTGPGVTTQSCGISNIPNATITSVIIMGSVDTASTTMGVKYVKVYQLSGS